MRWYAGLRGSAMTARLYQLAEAGYTRSVVELILELQVLALLVGVAMSIALLVRRVIIVRADAVAPAQTLTVEAGEALVRSTQLRAIAAALIVGCVIAGGWRIGVHLVVLFSIAFAFALQSYMNAWRVQHLLRQPRSGAELRGTTLTACADGSHASVIVSMRAAASTRELAMPRAKIV
jgi:hypothetical protein